MRDVLLQVALAVGAAGAIGIGLTGASNVLRGELKAQKRYKIPFANIECNTPSDAKLADFLAEVQYFGEMGEDFSLLERNIPNQVASGFSRHPWVEKVQGVSVTPDRRILVRLQFRTPVLAVSYTIGEVTPESVPITRVVDRSGVLLPREASTDGVARLAGVWPAPAAAGRAWGHRDIEAVAKVAGAIHEHQDKLDLRWLRVTNGELSLSHDPRATTPAVIWGSLPGQELEGESAFAAKLERLVKNYPATAKKDRP